MAKDSILIFPIKTRSERVPRKNFTLIGGVPMYQITPERARDSGGFSRIVIDSDSEEILDWATGNGFQPHKRLPSLAEDTANGNDLLRHHVETFPGYDYYWQGFVTAPYISIDTIRNITKVITEGLYDSVMTVKFLNGHFWYRGIPLYRTDMLPRSQDLPPLQQEVSGFFGITSQGYASTRCRVGRNPCFYGLSSQESLDIDWYWDLEKIQK